MDTQHFGEFLKNLRESLGLTQEEFASEIGMHRIRLSHVEQRETHPRHQKGSPLAGIRALGEKALLYNSPPVQELLLREQSETDPYLATILDGLQQTRTEAEQHQAMLQQLLDVLLKVGTALPHADLFSLILELKEFVASFSGLEEALCLLSGTLRLLQRHLEQTGPLSQHDLLARNLVTETLRKAATDTDHLATRLTQGSALLFALIDPARSEETPEQDNL